MNTPNYKGKPTTKVWKVLRLHDKERLSCFTSVALSKSSPFVIKYPKNKWIQPHDGTKLFAFRTKKAATYWIKSLVIMYDGYSLQRSFYIDKKSVVITLKRREFIIVPALATNPQKQACVLSGFFDDITNDTRTNTVTKMWEDWIKWIQDDSLDGLKRKSLYLKCNYDNPDFNHRRFTTYPAPHDTLAVDSLKCLE